jgi:predicted AAA+ superfamily ATPase
MDGMFLAALNWKRYGKDTERIRKGYGKDTERILERIRKGYGKDTGKDTERIQKGYWKGYGKDTDSKTVTVATLVKSLGASLILFDLQGVREYTGGSDITFY